MANPKRLYWSHGGENTDGSAFDASQFKRWELEVNGIPVLSVPAAWELDGAYDVPLADFAVFQETGEYTVRMRVVNVNDIPSDWSNAAAFSMDFRVPAAPTGLSVG